MPGATENAIYPQLERWRHLQPLPDNFKAKTGAIGVDFGRSHLSAAVAVHVDAISRRYVRETWVGPGDSGLIKANVARMELAYGINRGRTDPNQAVLADALGFNLAKMGEGTRQQRVGLVTRLLNSPGATSSLVMVGRAASSTVVMEPNAAGVYESSGLIIVREGPGNLDLYAEMEAYHYVEVESPQRQELVVAQIHDDRVAALEYAIEELDNPTADYSTMPTRVDWTRVRYVSPRRPF